MLGVVAAAVAAVLGALVLGEYDLTVWTALAAGLIFGLLVAETPAVVGAADQGPLAAVTSAVLAAAGLTWAELRFYGGPRSAGFPGVAWEAIAIGTVTAGVVPLLSRLSRTGALRRSSRTGSPHPDR